MGIFRKTADTNDELALTDTLPEYVDKLLDEADLESIQESDAISLPNNSHYGIDEAVKLMNKLPQDNRQLIVTVVRETLSSVNIDVATVVTDAEQKAEALHQKIIVLSSDIASLKEQIAQKENLIRDTKRQLQETLSVKELLESSSEKIESTGVETSLSEVNNSNSNKDSSNTRITVPVASNSMPNLKNANDDSDAVNVAAV